MHKQPVEYVPPQTSHMHTLIHIHDNNNNSDNNNNIARDKLYLQYFQCARIRQIHILHNIHAYYSLVTRRKIVYPRQQ